MPTLLIVDDDVTMSYLLKTLLELDGFDVVTSPIPDRFLASLRETDPDLIIMDVYLANGDGIELLRRVRSSPGHADTPVIMTSGMDVSDQCMDAGADGFMLKPYSPDALIDLIKSKLPQ